MSYNKKMYELGSKRSVIRELFEYGKKRAAEVGADNVYDFSLGNPSVPAPKEVNEAIVDILSAEDSLSVHGYTSAQGDAATREAVADVIRERFGVPITSDYIYMTCGAAASLTISLRALIENTGDECIVFAPYFTEYKVFIENAGGKVVESKPHEDTLEINLADFESRITSRTRAVIVNSPNNPSGVVYGEKTIVGIADVLRKKSAEFGHAIYIIADEPYRELVYSGVKVPYIMNYYDDVMVCYSYSKALSLPGERIGYIAVSPSATSARDVYLAVCGAGRSLGYVCAPSLMQKVIARCARAKADIGVYKENRDILYNALVEYGYKCVRPDGAFYLFVRSLEPDAIRFCERAKKHDVLIVPCDDFGISGYVRIAYCVDKSKVMSALPAFKKLKEEYDDSAL